MFTQKSQVYALAPLLLILIIDVMGMGLVLPVLGPIFMDTHDGILAASSNLATRDFLYGLTMATYSFFAFFGAPLLGDLSDRSGRKKILLLCLLGTSAGFLLSAIGVIQKSIVLLLTGRAVGGFMAGSQSIAQAAIIDLSNQESKANNLSLMSIASCLGFLIGPIMGGYFSNPAIFKQFSASTPFLVAVLLALINAVALLFTFRETVIPTEKNEITLIKGLLIFTDAFKYAGLRTLAIIALLLELAWALYFQFISLYLTQAYHYTSTQIGYFMGFMSFVFSFSTLVVIRILLNRLTVNTISLLSLVVVTVGMFIAAGFNLEWMQWLSVIPIAFGVAVNWPAMLTLFSNAVDKKSQGWAMGVFSAIVSASWLVTGLAMGLLGYLSIELPFLIAALLAFASGVVMYSYNRRSKFMARISLHGKPINTIGNLPKVGSQTPDFKLTKTDLSEVSIKDFAGKNVVLNIFPSLDTSTCAKSVRQFNQEATKIKNAIVLCVSADLPFAQQRFCGAEGLNQVVPLSVFRHKEFGDEYGVRIVDGPIAGLMSRAVIIVDKQGKVVYTEQVPEIANEPNYQAALKALETLY